MREYVSTGRCRPLAGALSFWWWWRPGLLRGDSDLARCRPGLPQASLFSNALGDDKCF